MKNGTGKTRIEKSIGQMLRIGAKNSDPVEAAMSVRLAEAVEQAAADFRRAARRRVTVAA